MATSFTVMMYLAGIFFIAVGIGFVGWPAIIGGFIILGLGGIHEMLREIKATLSKPVAKPHQSWPQPTSEVDLR